MSKKYQRRLSQRKTAPSFAFKAFLQKTVPVAEGVYRVAAYDGQICGGLLLGVKLYKAYAIVGHSGDE